MSIHERAAPPQANEQENTYEKPQFDEYETVRIFPTDERFTDVLRLRADVYVDELKFLGIDQKLETGEEAGDEYDLLDSTAHFAVYGKNEDASEIIGTIRVIQKDDQHPLPIENHFKDDIGYVPSGSTEVSRFILKKEFRAKESELFASLLLIRAGINRLLELKSPNSYAVLEKDLIYHLRDNLGIPYKVLGGKKYLEEYNSENYATVVEPDKIIEAVHKHDRKLSFNKKKGVYQSKKIVFGPFFQSGLNEGWGQSTKISDLSFPESRQKSLDRNRGFLSKEDQEKIIKSRVSIAGVGGDGGRLAVELARLGVSNFQLADPESFEFENLNRQEGSDYESINKNKAYVIADEILKINPFANVTVFPDGISESNISQFIDKSDLVIDETEMTLPELGVMIAQEARVQDIPVLMALNVGYGCQVTSFDPKGYTFERKMGLKKDINIDEVRGKEVGLHRWLAHIPSYVDYEVFKDVELGKISAPSLVQGVDSAASIGATEAIKHLTNKEPVYAPRVIVHDAYEHKTIVSSFPLVRFSVSALKMILRSKLKSKH